MIDSYIEKEVVRIRRKFFIPVAKSERYGFLFDLYCWLHMSEKENIALTDLGQWDDAQFIWKVSYYAAVSACKERGAKVTFTKEDILNFLNDLSNKDYRDVYNAILKSRVMGKSLEEWAAENMKGEAKKKSTPKTSKTTPSQS